jgi:hypothetical protein
MVDVDPVKRGPSLMPLMEVVMMIGGGGGFFSWWWRIKIFC